MEQSVDGWLKIDNGTVQVPIQRYEILTLRVDYGREPK